MSSEKEAKRLLFVELGVSRSGIWPENGVLINSLADSGRGERLPELSASLLRILQFDMEGADMQGFLRCVAWACLGIALDASMLVATSVIWIALWATVLPFSNALPVAVASLLFSVSATHLAILPGIIWPGRTLTNQDFSETAAVVLFSALSGIVAVYLAGIIEVHASALLYPRMAFSTARWVMLALILVVMVTVAFIPVAIARSLLVGKSRNHVTIRIADAVAGSAAAICIIALVLWLGAHAGLRSHPNQAVPRLSNTVPLLLAALPHLLLASRHDKADNMPQARLTVATGRTALSIIAIAGVGAILWAGSVVLIWARLILYSEKFH